MDDMFSSMGIVNKIVREGTPQARVLWTPSIVPRPEATFRGGTPSEIREWLFKDSKFLPSNISRIAFLQLLRYSPDIIPVPNTVSGLKDFYINIKDRLKEGNVLAIFPEGEVSVAMRKAESGFVHIAVRTESPVLPIAQYNEGGKLIVRIGSLKEQPSNLLGKEKYLNSVMYSIADMLPEHLRGYYGTSCRDIP